MKKFFAPNITGKGRVTRGVAAVVLLTGGVILFDFAWWLGAMLLVAGAVGVFEALRGWCLLRACGVRTRF